MKKVFLVLFFIFISAVLFASGLNVCITPYNEELAENLEEFLDVKIVKTSVICDNQQLEKGDFRLLEYICNSSNADLLLIPIIQQISDYNHLKLYSYKFKNNEYKLEYETISKDNSLFSFDIIKTIFSSINNLNSNIEYENNETYRTFISNSSLLVDCTNTTANIYLNDEYLGQTPLVIDSYYVPSLIKFCADGFETRTYSLSNLKQTNITVSLISSSIADSSNFTKSQNRYLISFAATILGWGSRVVVKALNVKNTTLSKVLDYSSLGLAISSSAYLTYNIYKYFKNTQITAP